MNDQLKTLKIFENIDNSVLDYWKKNGNLNKKNFWCRNCGKFLLNLNEILELEYISNSTRPKRWINQIKPYFRNKNNHKLFIDNDNNRWIIKGKEINGKTYFRRICWDCLFKLIPEYISENYIYHYIDDKNFKYWNRLLQNGTLTQHLKIPKTWNSPVWWFKLLFDISIEELNDYRSKFDTASLNSFIKRFGEKDGIVKYHEYCKVQSKNGCSLDYFIEKFGKIEGLRKYKEICQSKAVTKDNCIKKYGIENGIKFWNSYVKTQSYAGTSLQYFIDTYGNDIGKRKYLEVCAKKSLTLDNFIQKYGKEEGQRKFANLAKKPYSDISQKLFNELDEKDNILELSSQFATKNQEATLSILQDDICQIFHPDYIFKNKIIEFNGDYWHANPKFYKKDDIVFCQELSTAGQIWEKDQIRLNKIKKLGYKVKIIWENDFYSNHDNVIQDCINFLTKL